MTSRGDVAEPFRAQPFVLCSEEARWFAGRLFGRCDCAELAQAEAPGWNLETASLNTDE